MLLSINLGNVEILCSQEKINGQVEVARGSGMFTEDPEIEDLLYTLKAGDPDQDSYFQNGDPRSELFKRCSLKDVSQ